MQKLPENGRSDIKRGRVNKRVFTITMNPYDVIMTSQWRHTLSTMRWNRQILPQNKNRPLNLVDPSLLRFCMLFPKNHHFRYYRSGIYQFHSFSSFFPLFESSKMVAIHQHDIVIVIFPQKSSKGKQKSQKHGHCDFFYIEHRTKGRDICYPMLIGLASRVKRQYFHDNTRNDCLVEVKSIHTKHHV